jgi:RNA polymerase sigma factor (sigma-70 family)
MLVATWQGQLTLGREAYKLAPMFVSAVAVPDEQLAIQVAEREGGATTPLARGAFTCLYDRHAPALAAFLAARVRRSELDDVQQVVWHRVWDMLSRQPFSGHFRGWLFTVARNYLIDLRRKHTPDALPAELDLSDEAQETPAAQLLDAERWHILGRCLARLDAALAELVRGRLGGQSYDELCARLNLEPAKAHRMFHTAKDQLQACVQHALA